MLRIMFDIFCDLVDPMSFNASDIETPLEKKQRIEHRNEGMEDTIKIIPTPVEEKEDAKNNQ